MAEDWREQHANEAAKALQHPLVARAMAEYAENMHFDKEAGLPAHGMQKVALYAAAVARAKALGIDPDRLRLSPEEGSVELLRQIGKPPHGSTRLQES